MLIREIKRNQIIIKESPHNSEAFVLKKEMFTLQKKTLKCIAIIIMCIITLVVLVLPNLGIVPVSAATYDVNQLKRIADVSEFPKSYQAGLTRVKEVYPNAQFIYYNTDLDWDKDLLSEKNEMKIGRNLVPSNSPSSWKSTDSRVYNCNKNAYTEIEPGWNQASTEVVEHYMDPRNFFNKTDIFQFLDLSFNGYETINGIQSILNGSFMEEKTIVDIQGDQISYAEALYQIGKEIGISPYLLACRIIQEQGDGNSALISGAYSDIPGYYNYFNVNAYGSTTEAIISNGLKYAKKNEWNTPYKSIYGGAQVLAENYVYAGKNCLYFQHFNVTAQDNVVDYSIYMANTLAPYYEARSFASACTDDNTSYVFIIPVYDNMPEYPCDLPLNSDNYIYNSGINNESVDDNNDRSVAAQLKKLILNDGELDIGDFSSSSYHYQAYSTSELQFVTIKAEIYSDKSHVSINGSAIDMANSTTLERAVAIHAGFNTISIVITADDGLTRDYTIDIVNDNGSPQYVGTSIQIDEKQAIVPSGKSVSQVKKDIKTLNCSVLVTNSSGKIKNNGEICTCGDMLVVKNNSNQIVYSSKILIEGDVNQDGYVTEDDIAIVKSHILETYTMSFCEQQIADVDNDEEITVKDLGKIKILTGNIEDKHNSNISIYPNAPKEIYEGKTMSMTISASDGNYYAEGYLVYNEGKITIKDENNSGRVHFIADGSSILFANNSHNVKFVSLIRSGSIDFDVEVKQAYDYRLCKYIEVLTQKHTICVENSELEVDLQINKSAEEGASDGYHAATLTIKNISSKSIGNISIDLGDFLTNDESCQKFNLTGLKAGHSQSWKVYTKDDLQGGIYESLIIIKYQDANCIISLMQIPTSFEVLTHEHEEIWQMADAKHYVDCSECDYEVSESHLYVDNGANAYKCVVCGYTKTFELEIKQDVKSLNMGSKFTSILTENGKTIANGTVRISWYVDGERMGMESSLYTGFNSVGYHTIDCVITNTDGLIVTKTINVYIEQGNKQNYNSIRVVKANCDTITMKRYDGYEYKINDGKWQDSPMFTDLIAGQEYIVHQRKKGQNNDSSVKVLTNHNIVKYEIQKSCGKDVLRLGSCIHCNQESIVTFENTMHNHAFVDYKETAQATCSAGTIEIADCIYECGVRSTRALHNKKAHLFTNYTTDNNATCVDRGTSTAYCDHGCGTADIVLMDGDANGHEYVYQQNYDATINCSMTETGMCKHCNQTNTRTVDGTRLDYIGEARIEISMEKIESNGLPMVTSLTDGVEIVDVIWHDDNGMKFVGNVNGIVMRSGETYKLATLILSTDDKYEFSDNVALYVNETFVGESDVDDGDVEFNNVGQFSLK